MKKHLKWIIPTALVLVVAIGVGIFFLTKGDQKMPTEIQYYSAGDGGIDTNNINEVVGAKSYVFVCRVDETYDYYTDKSSRDFPDAVKNYDRAFTECRVTVIKNIKGELKENSALSFYKTGGVSNDKKYISLVEGDIMPEIGKYYIFTGIAHEDGTLTGGGTNGTIALEDGITPDNLDTSELYKKYVKAYEEQVLPSITGTPSYLASDDIAFDNGNKNAEIKASFEAAKN